MLDDELPAIPCGLMAKSMFTDSFNLYRQKDGEDEWIEINQQNIAWASDIEYKFKNIEGKGNWKDI